MSVATNNQADRRQIVKSKPKTKLTWESNAIHKIACIFIYMDWDTLTACTFAISHIHNTCAHGAYTERYQMCHCAFLCHDHDYKSWFYPFYWLLQIIPASLNLVFRGSHAASGTLCFSFFFCFFASNIVVPIFTFGVTSIPCAQKKQNRFVHTQQTVQIKKNAMCQFDSATIT